MSSIYEPCYKVFVDCLKDFRLQSKMTQQELASLLGYAQSYVSKYEQGQKRLDIVEIKKICDALGITLLEFVAEYESRLLKGVDSNEV